MESILVWTHLILANHPLAAPLVFVGVHTLMAVFFLPCSPMTIMAGALWGGVYGLIISIGAAIVSLATTFILSRSFLHNKIERFLMHRYPKVAGLLTQVAVHDWKLIAVTQLNPLIPASAMGYLFGLTKVSFLRYLMFAAAFMVPLQVLFVTTGNSVAGSIASRKISGLAIALIIVIVIIPIASKYIYKKFCQLFWS